MATLERVMQMKQQGASEPQIIDILRKEGISPKEINDALTQATIKSQVETQKAVVNENTVDNMRPSIMAGSEEPQQQYEDYSAQPEQEQYVQPNQYYPEQYYPEYQPQQQQASASIEAINEITEQIIEEKNSEIKKQLSSLKTFKEESKFEIEKIKEKIDKIENIMNELQLSIIRKIGQYGEDIKNIADEMHSTQESFSKIINPLADNINELKKINQENPGQKQKEKQKEQKREQGKSSEEKITGFENYLR